MHSLGTRASSRRIGEALLYFCDRGSEVNGVRRVRTVIKFRRLLSGLATATASAPAKSRRDQQEDRRRRIPSDEEDHTREEEIGPLLKSHPYRRFIKQWKSKEELAEHLLNNIVHNAEGIVAFNKPYGVGVSDVEEMKQHKRELAERQGKIVWHDPPKAKEPAPAAIDSLYHARGITLSKYTLFDVLPILQDKLGMPELLFSKSTEKFSSGVAVFSENRKISERLKFLYKGAKMSKVKHSSYLIVSTLTPELENDGALKETVGISTKEQEFKGREVSLPIIERKFSNKRMKNHEVIPVQAEVRVVSRSPRLTSALTEIHTTVTKHHFLRAYANDLLMPILGDHLFSNRVQSMVGTPIAVNPLSVEPGSSTQVMSTCILKKLHLSNRSDAIIIPLHAHLHRYTVAHFFGKWKHLVMTAPPPNYFQWTCSQLNIDLDKALNKNEGQS